MDRSIYCATKFTTARRHLLIVIVFCSTRTPLPKKNPPSSPRHHVSVDWWFIFHLLILRLEVCLSIFVGFSENRQIHQALTLVRVPSLKFLFWMC